MDKLSAIRKWFTGVNRYHWAQALGHRGTPYFRYDTSHHLHRGIDKLKLTKNLGVLFLTIGLILIGVLQLVHPAIPDISMILAILAIAAGISVLLRR